jgi:hypothetical protein
MMKAFRVAERVRALSSVLQGGSYGPPSFYEFLEGKGVDWRRSVLIDSVPEQGPCLCGRLIDARRRLIEFDLEFEGSGTDRQKWGEIDEISTWEEQVLGKEWWKAERPRGTQARPNDSIAVGLTLLGGEEDG